MNQRLLTFLAFTAAFAALAGFVFWGTWSLDFVPVMPDHPTTHSLDHLAGFVNRFLSNGKFVPGDLTDVVGSPYFWQELKYVLALYFAALGLAYFCRGRGLPRLASYGAGLLLAFCGYWMTLFSAGHYGWFQWMTYGVFAFGLVDRAVAFGKLRHWLLLGACMAWSSFNQQDLWLLFAVLTAAYFALRCLCERKFPWKGVLASAAVFFLVGMPCFKDAFQNVLKGREETIKELAAAQGQGGKGEKDSRWEFVTNWSMPPEDTAEFLVPGVHGDTSCPFVLSIGARRGSGVTPYAGRLGRPMNAPSGNYRQHSLYLGWALCLFAALGLLSSFVPAGRLDVSRPTVWFFAGAALVCYLLSLGRFFEPAYRLVFAIPIGDTIRCPVKWHHLTEFCLAVLAAYGIAGVLAFAKRLGGVGRHVPWIVGGLVLLGAFDLARVDRRYCAPFDVTEARRTNSSASLTFLPKQQFQNPQVAEMVRQKRIVSVATYFGNPDVYLVEVLQPFGKEKRGETVPFAVALGIVSVLTGLGVLVFSVSNLKKEIHQGALTS